MNHLKNPAQNLLKNWSDKVKLGNYELKNRIVLSALTRQRCDIQTGVPNQFLVEYYSQRSGAGLLLTQSASWSQRGQSFPGAANLYSNQQSEGWKRVIQGVHKKDSFIYAQLNHGGRACFTATTRGLKPWSSSPLRIRDYHNWFKTQHQIPHQMSLDDIKTTQQQWAKSVKLAKQSGFDGIQLHGANGYLTNQFFNSWSNKRIDNYGGSAKNRCRFALELIDIALQYFKPHQVGIKISPCSRYNDMYDDNPIQTFSVLLQQLSKKNIGFVEIVESVQGQSTQQVFPKTSIEQIPDICQALRPHFNGLLIANGQNTPSTGLQKVRAGRCDLASFGRFYVSNPDLAQRILNNQQWNMNFDYTTFFRGPNGLNFQSKGYTDYPFYEQWKKSQNKV